MTALAQGDEQPSFAGPDAARRSPSTSQRSSPPSSIASTMAVSRAVRSAARKAST